MLEILLVVVVVLVSGFFALSEMAVVTSRKSRLKQLAQDSRGARKALELSEHPESFLSAVQFWITLLGILTGSLGVESLSHRIEPLLLDVPLIAIYAPAIANVLSLVLITFISVVLGELVPKRLGTLRPEPVASRVALPMHFLSTLARPAVVILASSTRLLMRLLGFGGLSQEKVTEEEIRHLVAESHEQGVIDEDERNMLNRVLRLGDRSADSLMTPRTRIVWLDAASSRDENLEILRDTAFSRYPVYRGSDADVLGVFETKYLGDYLDRDGRPDLFAKLRPPLFVSEATNALKLLEIFREEQQSLALVVDEYGDIQGVVTLTDLLGAVLGRLQDVESESEESLVVERADGTWLVDGRLSVEEFRELLSLQVLPGEQDNDFTTVAGMVIARYGRIPHAGEHFDWQGWRIEVVDLDGARVDKLLVVRSILVDNDAGA
jgi:putative hemolysin